MIEKCLKTRDVKELFEAIAKLENVAECQRFFRDLCTLSELRSMSERYQAAKMIKNKIPYREISKKTKSSTATITRVAHWFHHGPGGYRLVLGRMK